MALEQILTQPNFIGSDITGMNTTVNLAINQILDRLDELGFEIAEKITK